MTGTLHEDVFTFRTISGWILLRMRNVWNENCREHQNTFYTQWLFSENRAVYEIMSKNMSEPERTQTIWRLRVAYWISKCTRSQVHARARAPTPTHPPTYTHTRTHRYLIVIAFPPQLWLRERSSVLRYTYIALLLFMVGESECVSDVVVLGSPCFPHWIHFDIRMFLVSWAFQQNYLVVLRAAGWPLSPLWEQWPLCWQMAKPYSSLVVPFSVSDLSSKHLPARVSHPLSVPDACSNTSRWDGMKG